MAHMLDQTVQKNGAMFSVGETPWHRLGVVLEEAPQIAEAIKAAGLDWKVGTKPLFTSEKEVVPAMATFREDTGKILGVVGPNYKALQNAEAFEFFQPFLDSNAASLETAGALNEGKRIWVMAKLNSDPIQVTKEDTVNKYVLLSNSHDGTMAVRVGFTGVRVVCSNTLAMAHNAGASKLIRVKHIGDISSTLESVRDAMNTANASFEATAEQYRAMASKPLSEKDLEKYVKIVFATKKQLEEASSEEDLTSGSRVMEKIKENFAKGLGNDMPTVRGTVWAGYNAIQEFLQYSRGENESRRLDSLWFGQGAAMNKKALDVGFEMVKVG